MARQRRPVSAQAARRKRVWARDDLILTPDATGVPLELGVDFSAEYGTTRVPLGTTIGGIMLDFSLVQLVARASSTDGLALGVIVTDDVDAGDIPRPVDHPHADWMWMSFIGAPGSGAGASRSTWDSLGGPLKLRSKRKMEELGSRAYIVGQLVGSTTYDLRVRSSVLLLMP